MLNEYIRMLDVKINGLNGVLKYKNFLSNSEYERLKDKFNQSKKLIEKLKIDARNIDPKVYGIIDTINTAFKKANFIKDRKG